MMLDWHISIGTLIIITQLLAGLGALGAILAYMIKVAAQFAILREKVDADHADHHEQTKMLSQNVKLTTEVNVRLAEHLRYHADLQSSPPDTRT